MWRNEHSQKQKAGFRWRSKSFCAISPEEMDGVNIFFLGPIWVRIANITMVISLLIYGLLSYILAIIYLPDAHSGFEEGWTIFMIVMGSIFWFVLLCGACLLCSGMSAGEMKVTTVGGGGGGSGKSGDSEPKFTEYRWGA